MDEGGLRLRLWVVGRVLTLLIGWRFFLIHAFLPDNLLLHRLRIYPLVGLGVLDLLDRHASASELMVHGGVLPWMLWRGGDHGTEASSAKAGLSLHIKDLVVVILRESFFLAR